MFILIFVEETNVVELMSTSFDAYVTTALLAKFVPMISMLTLYIWRESPWCCGRFLKMYLPGGELVGCQSVMLGPLLTVKHTPQLPEPPSGFVTVTDPAPVVAPGAMLIVAFIRTALTCASEVTEIAGLANATVDALAK